jgi:tetratricopeptide (TPR) repeat protein
MAKRTKVSLYKQSSKTASRYKFDDLINLAQCNFDSNKFNEAEKYYEKCLEKAMKINDNPKIALSYFGWIMALINQNKIAEASELLKKVRSFMGSYLDSCFLEIMINYRNSNFNDTLHSCEEYIALQEKTDPGAQPHLASSFDSIAEVLWIASDVAWKTAEFKRSLEFQKRSLAMDRNNYVRRIVYASNLGKEGQIEEAIAVLDEGRKLFPREMAFENAKALIYGEAEKYDKARSILDGILTKDPRDVDAYVNYGVISERRGDYSMAEEYFKKALEIDPRHEIARSNIEHLNDIIESKHQKISLCMIVKNEEHFLPGCLKSAKGLIDELIVVDTGSTDRTMEIAKEYGAKIYEHPWQNDFSFHRNQSLGYASGDWILILDADEELDPKEFDLIRSAVMRKNIDAISFVVYNKIQGGRTGFLNSHRMFRNGKGYHYSGIVHNQLIMDGPALSSQFKVFHHGYGLSDEQMRTKGKRTETLLKQQLQENPDNAFAHFNLAQIYRGLGEPGLSLEHALRVTELLSPSDIDRRHVYIMALDQVGCSYVGLEKLDKAKEAFLRALEIKDDYLDPLFNLGYVYSRDGNFDKADEIFNRYLRVRESFAEHKEWIGLILNNLNSQFAVYYGLGLSQYYRQNIDKAIEYFLKVIEQTGDFEFTHHLLARCFRAKGSLNEIIYHCHKAVEFGHEDSEIHLLMGEAYLNLKDSNHATICFHKSLELNKDFYPSQLGLVSAASLDGDYDKALTLANQLLADSPHSIQALAARGDLLYHSGKFDSAAADYKDQTALNPVDPVGWNNLGNCLLKQGLFASAEEIYRKTLGISPNFAIAYRNLAISLLKQEKREEAVCYFEEYLTLVNNDPEVQIVLADLYYDRKEYWKAIANYESFFRQNPDQFDILLRLSDCYFNLGRFKSARLGYDLILKRNPENALAESRLRQLDNGLIGVSIRNPDYSITH